MASIQLTPFARSDKVRVPAESFKATAHRFGKAWYAHEEESLAVCFKAGMQIEDLAPRFGRDRDGVLRKLEKLGLIEDKWLNETYFYACDYEPFSSLSAGVMPHNVAVSINGSTITLQNLTKETPMSTPTIENKTFILGKDASQMSDGEIFNLIAKTEGELAKLKAITTKSSKLAAHIKKVEADLKALAAYLDGRE